MTLAKAPDPSLLSVLTMMSSRCPSSYGKLPWPPYLKDSLSSLKAASVHLRHTTHTALLRAFIPFRETMNSPKGASIYFCPRQPSAGVRREKKNVYGLADWFVDKWESFGAHWKKKL